MSYGDETADAAVLNVAEIGQMSPSPIRKRRKIRKGTQSCWECRRRKIRCTFATPMAAVCDGCRSRSTTCVGQEYCDQQESSGMVDLQTLGGREMHVDDEMQYAVSFAQVQGFSCLSGF
jgi:hypothetical protein